ncbi:hypothetical protein [Hahella ganghwensis]|uniref:hypothetical protein n=1 Tax=Hahella ganghwensis TaxID=286420 RepID=UPI000371FED5|nr:hypothetical protein [Hahella ganghwensis]
MFASLGVPPRLAPSVTQGVEDPIFNGPLSMSVISLRKKKCDAVHNPVKKLHIIVTHFRRKKVSYMRTVYIYSFWGLDVKSDSLMARAIHMEQCSKLELYKLAHRKKMIDAIEQLAESQKILEFVQFALSNRPGLELGDDIQQGCHFIIDHVKEKIEAAQACLRTDTQ